MEILLPASKSISNRILLLKVLSGSNLEIENLSDSDDTRAMCQALHSRKKIFDVGAAGTTMRFLTAFLAQRVGEWQITGSERMKNRPIRILVEALKHLGADITYLEKEGFPPLKITGKMLAGGEIALAGDVSSQYVSALIMIAPLMRNGLKINLSGEVISKPYIEMTQKIMCDFGVKTTFKNNIINIVHQKYIPAKFVVESDWSAASYWYEILTIIGEGKFFLKGLQSNSYQGDSAVADIFRNFGIKTTYFENGVEISFSSLLLKRKVGDEAFKYDFTNQPDLAQTLVVTCCAKEIPFEFSGLQSLKIKETDRISALMAECKKAGYMLKTNDKNNLSWNGEHCEPEKNIEILTYEDHRMAMAFAPLALKMPLKILKPEVVSKSYPTFWSDFSHIKPLLRL